PSRAIRNAARGATPWGGNRPPGQRRARGSIPRAPMRWNRKMLLRTPCKSSYLLRRDKRVVASGSVAPEGKQRQPDTCERERKAREQRKPPAAQRMRLTALDKNAPTQSVRIACAEETQSRFDQQRARENERYLRQRKRQHVRNEVAQCHRRSARAEQ